MRRGLRIAACLVLLLALGTWMGTGANRGWTKTSVPVRTVDAVTGLEGIRYQSRFVPGLDFLGGAALAGGFLGGLSLLGLRNRRRPENGA
jgi:hypothetical protein